MTTTRINSSATKPADMPRINGMDTAPKDGTYVLLFGGSGYITTPLRCEVCRYDEEYRPRQPWVNHANDSFEDGGDRPVGWLPLPNVVAGDLSRLMGAGMLKREDGWWFALNDWFYGPYDHESQARHEWDTRRALRDDRSRR